MTDFPRLIEHAFPLKQASLDSVHEKNVRHGHISTLHIWPARRPLAACRAALIATLLPDPGDPEKRKALCEKIAGRVVKRTEKKKMPNGQIVERIKEETEGGILHWGRETENAETLEWFRQEIRKAYGGRAPKVLDPFAGGGAIPLEAMRLGCEATAVDINPVAWFILKCTLEYPQKLAGQTCPLPEFILHDDAFMAEFFKKAKGYSAAQVKAALKRLHTRLKAKRKATGDGQDVFAFEGAKDELEADLAWHVRAWGQWVLARARKELAQYYPTYADFEPIKKDHVSYERQPMRLVPLKDDGTPDIDALNAEFTQEYLADKRNPRWVAKPTVAYLWARTVTCKNCRQQIPMLKTLWLCKKDKKRVRLSLVVNEGGDGVRIQVESNVGVKGGNAAQRREHDKRLGSGTVTRAGAKCPCCGTIMTTQDMKIEGRSGKIGVMPTAVVVDGPSGKEYRLPTEHELDRAIAVEAELDALFDTVPFGKPREPLPTGDRHRAVGSQLPGYGLTTWEQLFTGRQLLALGHFVRASRDCLSIAQKGNVPDDWAHALSQYLTLVVDKVADYGSNLATWIIGLEAIRGTFARFAFSWTWDFCETNPIGDSAGCYNGALNWTAMALDQILVASGTGAGAHVHNASSVSLVLQQTRHDVVITDPPYYDAIPYADLMDFFYVWMKRVSHVGEDEHSQLASDLSPNWDAHSGDGELIDDPGAYDGDRSKSKAAYERGMAQVFEMCGRALTDSGIMVVVFAHKHPNAWESLVTSIIRAGFIAHGSWPIQTERGVRTNAITTASLASSVWLVCKKRSPAARPGWDNRVLAEMRENISVQLREFWDAGIRGPDFVWAATGPALEAYSKHPVVRKANEPNATMSVGEFLNYVRRMVVDYVVGQVLTGEQGADIAAADRLDEVTAYYLLHRHDFGMDEAPVGACILYATACGLSDSELDRTWDILSGSGKESASAPPDDEGDDAAGEDGEGDPDADADASGGGGSKVKLKAWSQRKNRSMGYDAPEGKAVPLIDRIHRLMHLWKDGDRHKVDEYIDEHGLRRNELFKRVVQSLIELSMNSERSLLESISNHIGAKGAVRRDDEAEVMKRAYEEAGHAK